MTLLGKRIEFSGRSPIGSDVFLDLDRCGIPLLMARKLTLPERVTISTRILSAVVVSKSSQVHSTWRAYDKSKVWVSPIEDWWHLPPLLA